MVRQAPLPPRPDPQLERDDLLRYLREQVGDARRRGGLTQREAAAAFNVTERTWRHWELGKHAPEGYALLRLFRYLGLDGPELDTMRRYLRSGRLKVPRQRVA